MIHFVDLRYLNFDSDPKCPQKSEPNCCSWLLCSQWFVATCIEEQLMNLLGNQRASCIMSGFHFGTLLQDCKAR